jgi:hypothetical protein
MTKRKKPSDVLDAYEVRMLKEALRLDRKRKKRFYEV